MASLVADPALRGRLATAALAEVQGRTWAGVVDQLVAQHYGAVALGRAGLPLAA